MSELVKIAEGVLKSCLDAKSGESVLIVTDDSRKEIGEALYDASKNLGCEGMMLVMKERELSGEEPLTPMPGSRLRQQAQESRLCPA